MESPLQIQSTPCFETHRIAKTSLVTCKVSHIVGKLIAFFRWSSVILVMTECTDLYCLHWRYTSILCASQVFEFVHFFLLVSIRRQVDRWPGFKLWRWIWFCLSWFPFRIQQLFSPVFPRVAGVLLLYLTEVRYHQQSAGGKAVVLRWTLRCGSSALSHSGMY